MRIELTLKLQRGANSQGAMSDLVDLGGWLTGWQPETPDLPARVTFVFADRTHHDRFLRAALRVPGVASR